MGAFPDRGGGSRLVRNHERCADATDQGAVAPPERDLRPGRRGGTSTLAVDRHGARRVNEYVSLGGTAINCSGGITPWRTWLTCEETEDKAGTNGYTKDHGFIFEVDPYDDHAATPTPTPLEGDGPVPARGRRGRSAHRHRLRDRGRVRRAARAVLPVPARSRPRGGWGSLRAGGELQAMRVRACPTCSSSRKRVRSSAACSGSRCRTRWRRPCRSARRTTGKPITGGYKLEGLLGGVRGTAACTSSRRSPGPSSARRSTTTARSGGSTRERRRCASR